MKHMIINNQKTIEENTNNKSRLINTIKENNARFDKKLSNKANITLEDIKAELDILKIDKESKDNEIH